MSGKRIVIIGLIALTITLFSTGNPFAYMEGPIIFEGGLGLIIISSANPAHIPTGEPIPVPPITVISPNGGRIYQPGEVVKITWTPASPTDPSHPGIIGEFVSIEYSKDNFVNDRHPICAYIGSPSFDWVVPADFSTTVKLRIARVVARVSTYIDAYGYQITEFRYSNNTVEEDIKAGYCDTSDNYFTIAWNKADANNDGKVDISDLVIVASAFGSYTTPEYTHPKWNPIADLNGDNKVDILDLVTVASQYGKVKP